MAFPVLSKTVILCGKELGTFGVLRAGAGIQIEVVLAVQLLKELVGSFPLPCNSPAHGGTDALGGFVVHKGVLLHCDDT